jgi:site-specific DNA-methyltransferase (adenine-specific)
MHQLYHGDCLEILPGMDRVPCLFADPPDGIGLDYDGYDDNIDEEEYLELMEQWLDTFVETAETVWLSFNTKWTTKVGVIAERLLGYYPGLECKPCVQVFSFGQHNKYDFGNNHRPLWRFTWKDSPVYSNSPIYPDQIRIESERQKMGDKRADPRGRVPGDVFDFTRVVGNSKQRRKWHKTQLNEGLVERCIKSCTQEGDVVIDPFAGTGTTLRVCKGIDRSCITMDLSKVYCQHIADEHQLRIRSA